MIGNVKKKKSQNKDSYPPNPPSCANSCLLVQSFRSGWPAANELEGHSAGAMTWNTTPSGLEA